MPLTNDLFLTNALPGKSNILFFFVHIWTQTRLTDDKCTETGQMWSLAKTESEKNASLCSCFNTQVRNIQEHLRSGAHIPGGNAICKNVDFPEKESRVCAGKTQPVMWRGPSSRWRPETIDAKHRRRSPEVTSTLIISLSRALHAAHTLGRLWNPCPL